MPKLKEEYNSRIIAELEKKLGGKIDFFCNLPDKIEKEMKSKAAIAGFGL